MSWESVKIPDVLFFQEGPGVRNTQFTNHGVKLLNVGNINFGNLNLDVTKIYISEEEAYGKYKHFLVDEGDLLIASSGIVVSNFHNKITWACKEHLPLCLNTSTIRFKTLDPNVLDIKYFSYFLKSRLFADQLAKLITGSAQLNFGSSHLKQISLPLPTLATQKRIAEILDAADALRRKDQELLKKYDELAQAIFIDMFGDPVKNEKGWDVKKLGNVCKVQGGYSFKSSDLKDEGIKLVKIGNVHFEKIDWSEVECLPNSYIEKYKDFSLNEDDICIALTRPIIKSIDSVKVIKVNKDDLPCLLNQRVGRFIFDDKNLNSTYLLNFIYSKHFKNTIEKLCSTSLQPNIGTGQIEDIEIPLPPINIQNLFEKRVKSLLNIKKQSSTKESHFLFNSLIQKAFKGELVA